MGNDADKPESGAGEQPPPKIKAEDNPWYLLATLYGVSGDDKTINKNRVNWNRYFAANLDEEARTKLSEEKRHSGEELRPFSQMELDEVATAFAERRVASGKKLALPASDTDIDFSNVNFEQDAFFKGYLLSRVSFFAPATFSGEASFSCATFSDWASFFDVTFSGPVYFRKATLFNATIDEESRLLLWWCNQFRQRGDERGDFVRGNDIRN